MQLFIFADQIVAQIAAPVRVNFDKACNKSFYKELDLSRDAELMDSFIL
jgi:hypothetical protein